MSLAEHCHDVRAELELALAEARAVMRVAERMAEARCSQAERARFEATLAEAVAREVATKDPARAETARRLAERAARKAQRADARAKAAVEVFAVDFFAPFVGLQAARERLRDALAELEAAISYAERELRSYAEASWKRPPAEPT